MQNRLMWVSPQKSNARSRKRVVPGTTIERFNPCDTDLQPRLSVTLTFKNRVSNSRKALEGLGAGFFAGRSILSLALLRLDVFHSPRLDSPAPKRYPMGPVRQGSSPAKTSERISEAVHGYGYNPSL
jgi:hypothetical protein